MIVAVTYDVVSQCVYPHFGQSKYFLLGDTSKNMVATISSEGHGHEELIDYLAKNNVEVLICGGIGQRAVDLFKAKDIKVIPGISGSAHQAISKFVRGTLRGDTSSIHSGCGCHK